MSISKAIFTQSNRYQTYKIGSQRPMNYVTMTKLFDPDEAILIQALEALVERHENLRTLYFDVEDEVFQQVYPTKEFAPYLTIKDINQVPDLDSYIKETNENLKAHLFKFESEVSFKCILLKHKARSTLATVIDHMIYDFRSLQIITSELSQLYKAFAQGLPNPLKPLKLKFRDYSDLYNSHYEGNNLQHHQDYLTSIFKNAPHTPKLGAPYDLNKSSDANELGSTYIFFLDQELVNEIQDVARGQRCTLAHVLVASYCLFLTKVSDTNDFIVDTPISTRDSNDLNGLLGWMVGCLVYRVKVEPDQTFGELITSCAACMYGAMEHRYYQDVEKHLTGAWPDYAIQINVIDKEFAEIKDFNCQHKLQPAYTFFDFNFTCNKYRNGMSINCNYRFAAIGKEDIELFCNDFTRTLKAMVKSPTSTVQSIL